MRTRKATAKIHAAKTKSRRLPQRLILETDQQREFFRFTDGELTEYDLTRYDGRPVRITEEEKRIIEEDRPTRQKRKRE